MTTPIPYTEAGRATPLGLADHTLFVPVADEAVLYHREDGTLHLLDAMGALVVATFDGEADLDTLAVDIADAFGIDPERVAGDVLPMVHDLARRDLLAGVSGDPDRERAVRIEEDLVDGC